MLARQHAVDRVQRHAQEQDDRIDEKDQPHARLERDESRGDQTEDGRSDRHLIGGDAAGRKPRHQGPQQGLEARLQIIDGRHVEGPAPKPGSPA